jgi:hypothetical protein
MESTNESTLFELQIDHNGSAYLKEAARWAKFLAIVGFVFCALYVIVSLFAGALMSSFSTLAGPAGAGMRGGGAFITVLYILIAVLYFFPCLYLYNFASKAQVALRSNDQEQLNLSLKNLKATFRFMGILTIIGLCFALLGIIVVIIGFGAAGMR